MNNVVVNVACGGWYPKGQDRLASECRKVGYGGPFLFWKDEYPKGSPTHQEVPYGFKPHAIKAAMDQGYDLSLWCDASVWPVKSMDPIFDHIRDHGHIFWHAGADCGTWSTDACLKKLGVGREEAFGIPSIAALCMGFDFGNPKTREFIVRWFDCANDGVSFIGPHHNTANGGWSSGICSTDPRVKGHRHDQTVASIIIHRMGLDIQSYPGMFSYWCDPLPEPVIMVARGGA